MSLVSCYSIQIFIAINPIAFPYCFLVFFFLVAKLNIKFCATKKRYKWPRVLWLNGIT